MIKSSKPGEAYLSDTHKTYGVNFNLSATDSPEDRKDCKTINLMMDAISTPMTGLGPLVFEVILSV